MEHEHLDEPPSAPRAFTWVLCGFAAIAAFYLFLEHRAHALGFLPYALLLACPLMHLFMHGGHGGQSHRHSSPHDKEDAP